MPTQLRSKCPKCGAVVRANESLVGKRVRCPTCKEQFELTLVQFRPSSPSLEQAPQANETIAPGSSDTSPSSELYPPKSKAQNPAELGKLGRFELRDLLGQGAFGRVYRAYDPQLDREVALKVPLFGSEDQRKIERFITEAKAAARLHHANIVPIHDIGQADGRPYIVARFVRGETLSERVQKASPDFRQAAEWVRQLAEALAYAHSEGIVHRDIKPANVMLDEKGVPQIMDFGLAKRVNEDSGMTIDGTLLGTPDYMSPEQARGEVANIGPASDQYSLGVILYELLTGKRPFQGSPTSVVAQVLTAQPPAPRELRNDIPADLARICQRAMSKHPLNRFGSALEMANELGRWLSRNSARNPPIDAVRIAKSRSRSPSAQPRRTRFLWLLERPFLAALCVIGALGTATIVLLAVLGLLMAVMNTSDMAVKRSEEKNVGVESTNEGLQPRRRWVHEGGEFRLLESGEWEETDLSGHSWRYREITRNVEFIEIDALYGLRSIRYRLHSNRCEVGYKPELSFVKSFYGMWTREPAPNAIAASPMKTNRPQGSSVSSSSATDEFVTIFDGRSLAGWQPARENPGSFQVKDGAIVATGPRCHLFYVGDSRPFKNFHFFCEVKTKRNSNGGIYFHTKYQDTQNPTQGLECQISNVQPDQKTGSLYGIVKVTQATAVDDEWFKCEVIVEGKHVVIKIRDKVTVDYLEPAIGSAKGAKKSNNARQLGEGTFALQVVAEESTVYYRDIRVRRLPDTPTR